MKKKRTRIKIRFTKERILIFGRKYIYDLALFGRMALNICYRWETCAEKDRYTIVYSAFLLPSWLPLTTEHK